MEDTARRVRLGPGGELTPACCRGEEEARKGSGMPRAQGWSSAHLGVHSTNTCCVTAGEGHPVKCTRQRERSQH